MLMLEKFESEKLELAFLSDDSPCGFRTLTADEPIQSPKGLLKDALYTSYSHGYAWLYVVYKSDDASTWGQRKVKLLAGGTVLRRITTAEGAWTGQYRRLKFQVVARRVFHNIGGCDTSAPFQVILSGGSLHPDTPKKLLISHNRGKPLGTSTPTHALLGEVVPRLGDKTDNIAGHDPSKRKRSYLVPQPLGCFFILCQRDGRTETWIVGEADDFTTHRFALTEFSRRPLVRQILIMLGFVNPDYNVNCDSNPCLIAGHLRNIVASMDAMRGMCADALPQHSTKD